MLWLNANRDKIRSECPGMSVTDVSKKAGELWKGMSKEKKEVSQEMVWTGIPFLEGGKGGWVSKKVCNNPKLLTF